MQPDQRSESPAESLSEGRLGDVSFLAKALADENRLRLLLALRDGQQSVSQLVESMGLSQPLVSHHLRELKRTLLVEVERRGAFIFYRLSRPEVLDLLRALDGLAGMLLAARKNF